MEIIPSLEYGIDKPTTGTIDDRNENDHQTIQARQFLGRIQQMQLAEANTTAAIYKKGFRLTPIIMAADSAEISTNYGYSFTRVQNTYTVMESLQEKGRSLESYQKEYRHFSLVQALRSVEQVLLAVDEVHKAGYLHLDLQAGNVFLKGSLEDTSDFATLIDFGAARARMEDGKTEEIADRMLFASKAYSAPEMILHNDGHLRLGPEADFYSIGYLLLYLITGRKENPAKLYHNTDGIYIPARRMSSLQCPKHLQGKLQEIFRRALAVEPDDRYHTAQEMIRDIHELSEALQPYRSDLASVTYDAFICYRHNEMDSQIAKALQTQLEHFHVPRSLRSGTNDSKTTKKKIERVFLDQGELSSCGDMGSQIGEALKNSGYLIVLCSKETKDSPWVNLEIDTFLKYHDRSRILAILTEEGEPAELFPDQLKASTSTIRSADRSASRSTDRSASRSTDRFANRSVTRETVISAIEANQVFAADIRSTNYKDALKRLKKDAIYRIAAPILGTTYDSLKQRRKVYAVQRGAVACTLLSVLAITFAMTYIHQNKKISLANEKQLLAESNALIREAASLKEKGQMGDAVKCLLQALPSEDQPRPLVPKAENNLIDYLDIYESNAGKPQQLELMAEAQNLPLTDSFMLDPMEEYLLLSDDMTIHVLDSFSLTTLHTYSLAEPMLDLASNGDSNKWIPLDRGNMDGKHGWLFTHSNDQVICYDYKENELVWSREMTSVDKAGGNVAFLRYDLEQGQVYVAADTPEGPLLAVLEAETGEVCAQSRISKVSKDSRECTYIEADELAFLKENAIVFMTDQYVYTTSEAGTVRSLNQYIYVYDKNLKQRAKVAYKGEGQDLESILCGVNLLENESILLYMTEESYDAADGEMRGKGYLAAYDIEKQKVLYKNYLYENSGAHYACGNNLMTLDEQNVLSISENEFLCINVVDGSIISKGVDDWDTSLTKRDFQELKKGDCNLYGGRFLWNDRDYGPRFYDSLGTEYQFHFGNEDALDPATMEVKVRSLFPEEEGEENVVRWGSYVANAKQDAFYLADGSTFLKYGFMAENTFYHPLDYTQHYLDDYYVVGEWKNQTIFLHDYSYDEEDEYGRRIYYDELYYVDEQDGIHRIPLVGEMEPDSCELKGDIFTFFYSKDTSEDGYMRCYGRISLEDEELEARELAWDDYSGNTNFFLIASASGYGSAACAAQIQAGQTQDTRIQNGQIILHIYETDPTQDEEVIIDTGVKGLGERDSYTSIYADPSGDKMIAYVSDNDTCYLIDWEPSKKSGKVAKIIKEIPSKNFNYDDILWSEDGAYFLLGDTVYDSIGKKISEMEKKKSYNFRLISPDNQYIYYIFCNNLYQFDLATGTLVNENRIFTVDEHGEMKGSDDYITNPVDDVNYWYWKAYDDKLFLSTRFGSSWLISTKEDAFGNLITIPDEAVYNDNLQKFYIIKYYPEEGQVPFGYYDAFTLDQIREMGHGDGSGVPK